MKEKLAVFDLDGTLIRMPPVDAGCLAHAFREAQGIASIDTDWSRYVHATDSGIVRQIFRERLGRFPLQVELTQLKRYYAGFLEVCLAQNAASCSEMPGAARVLKHLRQSSDWAPAVAPGSWRAAALSKLKWSQFDLAGIPAAFADDAISREEIVAAAMSRACEQNRVSSFERVVFVGDGVRDVRIARRLGLAFVGIGSGNGEKKLRKAGATAVVENFQDIGAFVRALESAEAPEERPASDLPKVTAGC